MLAAQLLWITGMEEYYGLHLGGGRCPGDGAAGAEASGSEIDEL